MSSSTVKTIFFTLIGTVVVIVFGTILAEYFNMTLVSATLTSIEKLGASQAVELFAQETYKNERGNGYSGVQDIYDCNGDLYISGDFYNGKRTANEIWESLYNSDKFKQFVSDVNYRSGSQLDALSIMTNAVKYKVSGVLPSEPVRSAYSNSTEYLSAYRKYSSITRYANNLYTPINAGIPYIDKEVATRMFKWNITQLLSGCSSDNIRVDNNGVQYVNYNGYMCYTGYAEITSITYKVYNITNETDRCKFSDITGLNPDNLSWEHTPETLGIDLNERKIVIVASIEYSMPVSYSGITPLSSVVKYTNRRVVGIDNSAPSEGTSEFNPGSSALSGGGDYGASMIATRNGSSLSSGNLIFYIVK